MKQDEKNHILTKKKDKKEEKAHYDLNANSQNLADELEGNEEKSNYDLDANSQNLAEELEGNEEKSNYDLDANSQNLAEELEGNEEKSIYDLDANSRNLEDEQEGNEEKSVYDLDVKSQSLTDEQMGNEEKLFYDLENKNPDLVCESLAAYGTREKWQGEYTIEDYRNWPEHERIELIDGEIIKMDSPGTNHQKALIRFSTQVCNYINAQKGKCEPFVSPIDVQLDEDEKTMLQPDFIIVCDEKKIEHWGIWGAPDFVLEVLSPSTRTYDMVRKKNKYIAAGVKEYWILDLEKEKLITYAEGNGYISAIYPLQGKVGMALYGNDLEMDLDILKVNLRNF